MKERSLSHPLTGVAALPAEDPSEHESAALARRGRRDVAVGLFWLLGGLAFTAISYSSAHGGKYFIASGAIIMGAAQLARGLWRLSKASRAIIAPARTLERRR
jgi:hypothetical protein